MQFPARKRDDEPDGLAVRWLRLAKLVLTVILLALGVWNAFAGAL